MICCKSWKLSSRYLCRFKVNQILQDVFLPVCTWYKFCHYTSLVLDFLLISHFFYKMLRFSDILILMVIQILHLDYFSIGVNTVFLIIIFELFLLHPYSNQSQFMGYQGNFDDYPDFQQKARGL
jgi:hypothetical protein